jgi:hypothetical protein
VALLIMNPIAHIVLLALQGALLAVAAAALLLGLLNTAALMWGWRWPR